MLFAIAIALHLFSAILWVGGMFFAYVVLRPAAADLLAPSNRLPLWSAVFRRFFPWVWVAILILVATGNLMIFEVYGGMRQAGIHIHIMNGIAWIMILLFLYLNLAPMKGLRESVSNQDWPSGAEYLAKIRRVIAVNLSLGLAIVMVASMGRYLT